MIGSIRASTSLSITLPIYPAIRPFVDELRTLLVPLPITHLQITNLAYRDKGLIVDRYHTNLTLDV